MAINALYTGSAGLNTNSTALDVVGNNLANINTPGYKSQRTQFKDLVYQTLSAGSSATGNSGGTNPSQVGFGTAVGAIGTSFLQGNLNATGRDLDMGIQGVGFFVLSNGSSTVFSRAGAFSVDSQGFLVDSNTGYRVQRQGTIGEGANGFQVSGNQNIKIPYGSSAPGTATSSVNLQGNLSTSLQTGESYATSIQVFDTQSSPHTLTLTFTKTGTNTFTASATVSGGTVTLNTTTVTFDSNGLLQSPGSITATLNGLPGAQSVTLNLGTPGQSTGITQFGGSSSAAATSQDGRSAGTLSAVNVDDSGTIQGVFSNGKTLPIAQLSIAMFGNPGGLLREGNNYFTTSAASGEPLLGTGGSGGRGTVEGGTLESSNVDIAGEFSLLIITQRGFQVNARTVTAANEMLQELANIIR